MGNLNMIKERNPLSLSDLGFLCWLSHKVAWSGISSITHIDKLPDTFPTLYILLRQVETTTGRVRAEGRHFYVLLTLQTQ